MKPNKQTPPHRAHVASLTPGRLRIKLHPQNRGRQTMKGIQDGLQACEGVNEVRVNSTNGSLTVLFDKARYSVKGIMGLLEDVDVLVETVGHLPGVDSVGKDEGPPTASFIFAVEDLNRRIQLATGLPIDLKLVLPLSFISAGVWSITRRGLLIESVPGWLFLWFAFDMFVKMHPVTPVVPEAHELEWGD